MKRLKPIATVFSTILAVVLAVSMFGGCAKTDGKFGISVEATQGGTIAADKTSVAFGDYVTCTVRLDSGYALGKLTVNGGEVQPVAAPEGEEYDYIWRSGEVMRDYRIKAEFVRRDVTVRFNTGEGAATVPDQSATFGKKIGKLPKARKEGKRFLGWRDLDGNVVNEITVVKAVGVYELYAEYEDVDPADIEGLVPYAITSTYFDAAATAYGVVWHTEKKPIESVVWVAEKPLDGAVDWNAAREIAAESEAWTNEYISTATVDGLKFDTEYVVKVGDAAAGRQSGEFSFRTRKEQIDITKFFVFGTSAEEKRIGFRGDDEIGNTTYLAQVFEAAMGCHYADGGKPDFTAHSGSFVGYTSDGRYWKEMLSGLEDNLFAVPTVVTPGVREDEWFSGNRVTLQKLFHYNVSEGVDGRKRGEYYSFDFGPVHYISLSSNDVSENQKETWYPGSVLLPDQYAWLEDDLIAVDREKTPWVIVMSDEPIVNSDASFGVYGDGSNRNVSAIRCELGWQLWPLFTRYNVDLVLCGRQGYGTSSFPLAYDESVPESATSYPFKEIADANKKYVDHQRVSVVSSTTVQTLYDGVQVDKITYDGTPERRGTVCQALSGAAYSRKNPVMASGDDRFRTYGTHGKNTAVEATIKNYSAYSYIEATGDTLVVRTYGVDVKKRVKNEADDTVYLDGFMLTK